MFSPQLQANYDDLQVMTQTYLVTKIKNTTNKLRKKERKKDGEFIAISDEDAFKLKENKSFIINTSNNRLNECISHVKKGFFKIFE